MIKDEKGYQFADAEAQVKKKWEENDYFKRLAVKNEGGRRFRFLDGPITANNPMGIHHAFGRTLKDITIKYNSMKGHTCQYQNGFDAQGLWIEVEVEKQMGFKDKRDIIRYGMEEFTNACMERVDKYAGIITEQSKDLGQWMDWEHSYFTNTDENILGIWYFLKKCHEKNWIVKKHRVMSWCPRCGTSLSEHEMAGNYRNVTCKSVFFKLPLIDESADLLVWTTTPWTLTANAATAVNPQLNYAYVKVRNSDRLLICCELAVKRVIRGDLEEVVRVVKGEELLGKTYETVFPGFAVQQFTHKVIPWEDVLADEGTGLVHIAPGCGEEDFELGAVYNIPAISPINESGIITDEFGEFTGQNTDEAAPSIFQSMEESGKLYYILDYEHKYAHCWRCKTDIVYKLVNEWYIRSDEIRPQLLEAVDAVEWQPPFAKKRMVDWLNNMSDWNISRKRFYGLPLPIYECERCGKIHVIGSKEELAKRSSQEEVTNLKNLHRPWVDDIKITCDCGAMVSRIPEVGDCWLDAGITPFVTKGYFTDKETWAENFPSEVVIEMIEQIRLWFYSMLFMSVTLEGRSPYEKVVTYGSVVREDGEKFSKSAGKEKNIVLDEAIDKMGADTIRYLYARTTSVNDLRFGYSLGDEAKRRILAFWNTYTFFDTYASLDSPQIDGFRPEAKALTPNDKWVLQLVDHFINDADRNYAGQVYLPIIKDFERVIDDINNWYIRVNRKRFWKGETESKRIAYWVLYTVIKTIAQAMAPIIPFITDFIWHDMVGKYEKNEAESVHLSEFPGKISGAEDVRLMKWTEDARQIISIVKKLRGDREIMVKQPLKTVYAAAPEEYQAAVYVFNDEIKSEINIKQILFITDTEPFMAVHLSVNFSKAGNRLKQNVNKLKSYLSGCGQAEINRIYRSLHKDGSTRIEGFPQPLEKELFQVEYLAKAQYAIYQEGNLTIILDTQINDQLKREYLLRTLIRRLQVYRKDSRLKIESHVDLYISFPDEELKNLFQENLDEIKSELLIDHVFYEDTSSIKEAGNFSEIMVDRYLIKVKADVCLPQA